MIFKLHYWFMASGANALGILLGVFIAEYTDATPTEIGLLYMLMPFLGIIFRPIICSFADRQRAHQRYLITCLLITAFSYLPYVLVPIWGPELYLNHPRFCWYFFVLFKIAGDIAFGGASSIGDSLAINYAHRIGTDYGVYRIWATISWMVFGAIIGQVNEIWFLPKYVPAFMILISASLLNSFIIYLWPAEYFMMVPISQTLRNKNNDDNNNNNNNNKAKQQEKVMKKADAMTKSLMPKEVVWAHAKGKLLALFKCSCFTAIPSSSPAPTSINDEVPTNQNGGEVVMMKQDEKSIDRGTQIKVLLLLLRRDPRILLYAAMFVCAGATVIPLSFFYMSLAEICHTDNRCDFSQLGGFLQVSMASVETLIFLYIKQIIDTLGRLNTVSIAFALATIKYTFYGTIWPSMNPYFAIISEIPHGVIFSIYLTLMVELAHFFSNEVEFLIPELVERGVVESDNEEDNAKLKMSLAATMQALMASANDGLGRGFGALIYGAILDHYSYHTLWLIIGIGSAFTFVAVQMVNLFDRCLDLRLGLDNQFEKNRTLAANNNNNNQINSNKMSPTVFVVSQAQRADDTISIQSKVSGNNIKLAQVA